MRLQRKVKFSFPSTRDTFLLPSKQTPGEIIAQHQAHAHPKVNRKIIEAI